MKAFLNITKALADENRLRMLMALGFEDPPKLTKHLPDGQEKLAVYRRVRDEIRWFIEGLPENLNRG